MQHNIKMGKYLKLKLICLKLTFIPRFFGGKSFKKFGSHKKCLKDMILLKL